MVDHSASGIRRRQAISNIGSLGCSSGLLSRLAYKQAKKMGLKVDDALRKAGLSVIEMEDQEVRVGVSNEIRFVRLIADQIGDGNLGFRLPQAYDRAAIIHHRNRGGHDRLVSVSLPAKPKPREQWMTVKQAAAAIRAALRYQEFSEGEFTGLCKIHSRSRDKTWFYAWRNGPRLYSEWGTPAFKAEFDAATKERRQRLRHTRRHIARFMVFEGYMGSRTAVALSTSIEPVRLKGRPWIDLKTGLFLGLPQDQQATNKRRQQVHVPPPLLAHLRRWAKNGQKYVVEFEGKPVGDIHKAHDATIKLAGLPDDVTPDTWRHSVATWFMQNGLLEEAEIARWLGMSIQTLQRVYGHHRRDKSERVHNAFRSARRTSFAQDMREQEANLGGPDALKRPVKSRLVG